jgi:hypothetical protein
MAHVQHRYGENGWAVASIGAVSLLSYDGRGACSVLNPLTWAHVGLSTLTVLGMADASYVKNMSKAKTTQYEKRCIFLPIDAKFQGLSSQAAFLARKGASSWSSLVEMWNRNQFFQVGLRTKLLCYVQRLSVFGRKMANAIYRIYATECRVKTILDTAGLQNTNQVDSPSQTGKIKAPLRQRLTEWVCFLDASFVSFPIFFF